MKSTAYLLLIAIPTICGLLVYLIPYKRQWMKGILGFSGGFLLGITLLNLVPEVVGFDPKRAGVGILIGFALQYLLDGLSRGIEHGHYHPISDSSDALNYSILIGLSLHALMEGLPLGHSGHWISEHVHEHLLSGILLHKAPAAFVLSATLRANQRSWYTTLGALLLFASMTPIGALLSEWLAKDKVTFFTLLSIVTGSLLHIATTIFLESDSHKSHKLSIYKIIYPILGLLLAWLTI